MADTNGRRASKLLVSPHVQDSTEPNVLEFSWPLHVLKHRGQGGKPDVYTIGVWRDRTLEAICLRQPLENVLLVLGQQLTSADVQHSRRR